MREMNELRVRPAVLDDAARIIDLMRLLAHEPDNGLLFSSRDFNRTVDDQRRLIGTLPGNSLLLVATANGEIIGYLDCQGGTFPAVRHTARIAVMVREDWRNRGVGTALMQAVVDWARGNPVVHRLELDVFPNNARAIHVYEKVGFVVEGRKRGAYFKEDRYQDALLMSLVKDAQSLETNWGEAS